MLLHSFPNSFALLPEGWKGRKWGDMKGEREKERQRKTEKAGRTGKEGTWILGRTKAKYNRFPMTFPILQQTFLPFDKENVNRQISPMRRNQIFSAN